MKVDLRTIKAELREQAKALEAEVDKAFREWRDTPPELITMKPHRWFNWTRLENALYDFCHEHRIKNR